MNTLTDWLRYNARHPKLGPFDYHHLDGDVVEFTAAPEMDCGGIVVAEHVMPAVA